MNVGKDTVLTPGGYRPRSLVHKIEPGHMLDVTGGHLRMLHPAKGVVADFGSLALRPGHVPLMPANVVAHPGGARAAAEAVPAFGSGWIAYADWSNNTGHPISSFTTTWIVPPAPATQSGQTIFLFNGIQNSTMIYQPVLQWGPSAAGGGNFWAVASWYADGQGGQAFYSQLIPVNAGDTLVGVMTLTGQSGSAFSYTCAFQGIANSNLPIQNVQELTWCIETLEAYNITQCSDYPNTNDTAFQGIAIQTGDITPALTWAPVNSVTDCGQHAIVVSNASPGGEVDIYYRNPVVSPRVPGRSDIGAVSRSTDKLDIFVTDLPGVIRTAAWEPDFTDWWHGWWELNGGRAASGAPITAVSRSTDKLDVFVVGTDGRVYTAAWQPDFADGWHGWWPIGR